MGLFDFLKKDCSGFPISVGSQGDRVLEVQNLLISSGQPIQADGQWGPASQNAARAVLGTPTVSCDQYRQLKGGGLTSEKVETVGNTILTGIDIINAIKGGGQQSQPLPPPPPPPKDNTPVYLAIGGGVLVVLVLLVVVLKK